MEVYIKATFVQKSVNLEKKEQNMTSINNTDVVKKQYGTSNNLITRI